MPDRSRPAAPARVAADGERTVDRRTFITLMGAAAFGLAACGSTSRGGASTVPGSGSTSSIGSAVGPAAALNALKLVNWYPHDAAWSHLWTDATRTEITRDFAGISRLGANAVRVIVNAYAYGYPTPLPAMEAKLKWMVAAASNAGLQVQLTLFDFWQDYADIAGSTAWMQKVVGPYRDDLRVCFLELRNEIDPSDGRVLDWLGAIYPAAKAAAGSIPVTVSVTSGIGMTLIRQWITTVNASAKIDFYDIHWYGDISEATSAIATMKAACGDIPLYIGETGRTARPANSQTAAQGETAQADYLTSVIDACRAAGVPPPAPWVWQDFTPAALPFVGGNTAELYYGLLRLDGTPRPAYAVIERAFA